MYSGKVMEHFMMPRNAWSMPNADGVGCVTDAQCGDKFIIFIRVSDGIISKASFVVYGCGAAIASGSIITMLVKGKNIREALNISVQDVIGSLEKLPEAKYHCAELSVSALRAAIIDYHAKEGRQCAEENLSVSM